MFSLLAVEHIIKNIEQLEGYMQEQECFMSEQEWTTLASTLERDYETLESLL